MTINPFNITKAVDYTDEELNTYWVDFPTEKGFSGIIKPTSDMPMIILGSKGSGKTHIMKHFSFSMQNIRWRETIIEGLRTDGYLGVYLRCSGLNGFKFSGKGETDESWQDIFSYYLELWLSQLLLNNIVKLIESEKLSFNEHSISLEILALLDSDKTPSSIKNLSHIVKYFSDLQKSIDYNINNKAFTNKRISETVEILASPGKLIFGIPEILSEYVPEFKDLKFLYLLDEYENFTDSQQRYFNTLIRERKHPTCFKIGARRYGIRTFETLSAGEEIKSGSEYEEFDLDNIFRDNGKNYKRFIENICVKRLEVINVNISAQELSSFFEKAELTDFINTLNGKKEKKHIKQLEIKLNKAGTSNTKEIIKNITYKNDVFLERTNVLMFYRDWKMKKNLLESSIEIKKSCLSYSKSKTSENNHYQVIDKYKSDIRDILYRENRIRIKSYAGFDNLVKISNGIPRHFLIIMKHIFRWNDFLGNKIFETDKINIESQLNALSDTTNWFIEDSRYPGKDGDLIKECLSRLCDYLRELRFSDIPPECAISTFSIQSKVYPKEITTIFKFLEQYSYVIKLNSGRRDKNFNNRNMSYQINGLLASEFELSIYRRGIVGIDYNTLRCIFYPNQEEDYKKMLSTTMAKYNAPFNLDNRTYSLFE